MPINSRYKKENPELVKTLEQVYKKLEKYMEKHKNDYHTDVRFVNRYYYARAIKERLENGAELSAIREESKKQQKEVRHIGNKKNLGIDELQQALKDIPKSKITVDELRQARQKTTGQPTSEYASTEDIMRQVKRNQSAEPIYGKAEPLPEDNYGAAPKLRNHEYSTPQFNAETEKGAKPTPPKDKSIYGSFPQEQNATQRTAESKAAAAARPDNNYGPAPKLDAKEPTRPTRVPPDPRADAFNTAKTVRNNSSTFFGSHRPQSDEQLLSTKISLIPPAIAEQISMVTEFQRSNKKDINTIIKNKDQFISQIEAALKSNKNPQIQNDLKNIIKLTDDIAEKRSQAPAPSGPSHE